MSTLRPGERRGARFLESPGVDGGKPELYGGSWGELEAQGQGIVTSMGCNGPSGCLLPTLHPDLTLHTKFNSKWITNLNIKLKETTEKKIFVILG